MPPKTIEIRWPNLGVVRRTANRVGGRQEAYPTPWAMNVRLEDSLTNRLRGGSFTGQASADFTTDVGTSATTFNATLHGFVDGLPVQLTTTDTLPADLETATTYYVVNATLSTFQLAESYGGTAVTFSDDGTGTHTASPIFAKINPVYRDRAITFSENAITAARQGDSTDTDLDADVSDVARPILFQCAEAGSTGDTVVAVAPHKDSYLVCFTATETWVLSGDPATGSMRRVSDHVGILGASAWCVNHDTIYFMSAHGLYRMQADGSRLEPVSEDRVPEDLTGISDSDCILNYYHPDRGVYIHLTASPSWFYDTAREGFWPFYTTSGDSHVLFGPLRLGTVDRFGLIQTLHGIIASESSSSVTWAIVPGDTAEEAAENGKAAITASLAGSSYSAYVKATGTWTAGRSQTSRPRVEAMWACLWLSSTGSWAFEGATMNLLPSGGWR